MVERKASKGLQCRTHRILTMNSITTRNQENQGKSCEFRSKADDDDSEEGFMLPVVAEEHVPL